MTASIWNEKKKKVTAATRVPTKIYESPKQCHSVAAELSLSKD